MTRRWKASRLAGEMDGAVAEATWGKWKFGALSQKQLAAMQEPSGSRGFAQRHLFQLTQGLLKRLAQFR